MPYYYDVLAPHSARLDLWISEYQHIIESPGDIVEWYKGTGLRPYLAVLAEPEERERFLAQYRSELAKAYPSQADGRVIFPFRRLFLIAYR
jgi:trans-aconitate 2-methyltransferase